MPPTVTIDELWSDEPPQFEGATNGSVKVVIAPVEIELLLLDAVGDPIASAKWRVQHRHRVLAEGNANGEGIANIRIVKSYRLLRDPWINVQWGHRDSDDILHYEQRFLLGHERLSGEAAAQQKLAHLGWTSDDTDNPAEAFQREFGLDVTGKLDDIVSHVDALHDNGTVPPRKDAAVDELPPAEDDGEPHEDDGFCCGGHEDCDDP